MRNVCEPQEPAAEELESNVGTVMCHDMRAADCISYAMADFKLTVRPPRARLSTPRVSHSARVLYGVFVWARRPT